MPNSKMTEVCAAMGLTSLKSLDAVIEGDTASSTQAEALVMAVEARTGRRPRRPTELRQ